MGGMHADMDAQRFCEYLYQAIILFFAVTGFIGGYWVESFRVTVYSVFAGVLISSAVCVPDFGIFRGKNPPQWLPEGCTTRPAKAKGGAEQTTE